MLLGWKSQRGQSSDGELVTSRRDVDQQIRAVPKEHTAVEDTRSWAVRAPAVRVRSRYCCVFTELVDGLQVA